MQGLIKGKEDIIDFEVVDISKDRSAVSQYKVQATPTIIVFDKSGNQVKTFVGVPKESELKAAILQATGG